MSKAVGTSRLVDPVGGTTANLISGENLPHPSHPGGPGPAQMFVCTVSGLFCFSSPLFKRPDFTGVLAGVADYWLTCAWSVCGAAV